MQAVADEMDGLGDEMTAYTDKKAGELFTVGDEEVRLSEDEIVASFDDNANCAQSCTETKTPR